MHSISHLLLAIGLFLSPVIAASQAEEGERGRLPDGRAFRIDAEGNQLVDYIAELELSVQSLNRRIEGLENELDAKNIALAQGHADPAVAEQGEMRERTLAQADSSSGLAQRAQVNCPVCPEADPASRARLPVVSEDCTAATESLERKNEEQKETIQRLIEEREKQGKLNTRVVAELQRQLSGREQELSQLKSAAGHTEPVPDPALAAALKSQDQQGQEIEKADVPVEAPEQMGTARRRAIEAYKGNLSTEINKVRTMIATRDKLYREYLKVPRALKLEPARAVSSRNLSLDQIRNQMDKSTSMTTLSLLSRDISEIRAKISDDIGLLKRVGKVGEP